MFLPRHAAVVCSALFAAMSLSACTQLQEPDEAVMTVRESPTPNTVTTTVKTTQSKAPAPAPAEGFGTERVEINDNKPGSYKVTGVRIGAHDTFDRLVFDIGGTGTPWIFAQYDDQPSQPGSGFDVPVNGGAALRILVRGVNDPYEAPQGSDGHAPSITDVVYQGVDEGDSTWYIGVDKKRPFKIEVIENPTRVVVDFQK